MPRRMWQMLVAVCALIIFTSLVGMGQEQIAVDAKAQTTPFPHYW